MSIYLMLSDIYHYNSRNNDNIDYENVSVDDGRENSCSIDHTHLDNVIFNVSTLYSNNDPKMLCSTSENTSKPQKLDEERPRKYKSKVPLTITESFTCGAIAGAVSKTIIAPIDRVKLLYFVSPDRKFSFPKAYKTFTTIVKNSGFTGLFKGNGSAMWRTVLYSGSSFLSYDRFKHMFFDMGQKHDIALLKQREVVHFVSGSLGGVVSTVISHPLDVIRVRAGAHWAIEPLYPSVSAAISRIYTQEGIAGLYRGIVPSIWGILPYGGISFFTFELIKKWYSNFAQCTETEIPSYVRLFAGGVGGMAASTVCHPIHVIRRRIQVYGVGNTPQYSSTWDALKTIYLTEGVRKGLFKGLMLTYLKAPLASALAFGFNDIFGNLVYKAHQRFDKYNSSVTTPTNSSSLAESTHTLSPITLLTFGAIAGCVSKTVIAPADNVKILFQTSFDQFTLRNAIKTGRNIVAEKGFFALYRGNSATLLRVAPHAAITYTTYDYYHNFLSSALQHLENSQLNLNNEVMTKFLAGGLAGFTSTLITFPLDMMRARMAYNLRQAVNPYSGYIQGFNTLIQREGFFKLWSGCGVTLLGVFPYAGISFATYHTFKEKYQLHYGVEAPWFVNLLCGASAAVVAQSMTYPLDILRRRRQVGMYDGMSIANCFRAIYKTEGIPGFFKGLSMNWVKGPIASGVSFFINSELKSIANNYNSKKYGNLKYIQKSL